MFSSGFYFDKTDLMQLTGKLFSLWEFDKEVHRGSVMTLESVVYRMIYSVPALVSYSHMKAMKYINLGNTY